MRPDHASIALETVSRLRDLGYAWDAIQAAVDTSRYERDRILRVWPGADLARVQRLVRRLVSSLREED